MACTFIGDVHGWSDRLAAILPASEGQIVFAGDLIDRGPDSRGVLEVVHALCADGRACCVMGNHEFALVRALGVPELGIPGDLALHRAWISLYGGEATCASFGVEPWDIAGLRDRLGEHLLWLAGLPWCIDLEDEGQRYLVVHSGFEPRPLAEQMRELDDIVRWFQPTADLPAFLYERRIQGLPIDLPPDTRVVSGHTPMPAAVVTSDRMLVDTSGGKQQRPLSAIVMPSGHTITSQCLMVR